MAQLFFCNIGWMNHYEGIAGKDEQITGGGSYVNKHGFGNEVCNFHESDGGWVYGHVETIKDGLDRKIKIENIGGSGDFVDGVDVVWTATAPKEKGRRVIGWYRNARVYRERQDFTKMPSRQHKKDKIINYRICAKACDAVLLNEKDRKISMGSGKGWMGQVPWWTPPEKHSSEVNDFLKKVKRLLSKYSPESNRNEFPTKISSNSSPAASDSYIRYVESFEVSISPRHNELQKSFEMYLKKEMFKGISPDIDSVDLRFTDPGRGEVLVEVKPCDDNSARYAIRTAMGQLLDYQQREALVTMLMVVIEVKPNKEDRSLAISNGFAIAYPIKKAFKILKSNKIDFSKIINSYANYNNFSKKIFFCWRLVKKSKKNNKHLFEKEKITYNCGRYRALF